MNQEEIECYVVKGTNRMASIKFNINSNNEQNEMDFQNGTKKDQ